MTSALKKAAEKEAFNECLELNSSRDRLKQREREADLALCCTRRHRGVLLS